MRRTHAIRLRRMVRDPGFRTILEGGLATARTSGSELRGEAPDDSVWWMGSQVPVGHSRKDSCADRDAPAPDRESQGWATDRIRSGHSAGGAVLVGVGERNRIRDVTQLRGDAGHEAVDGLLATLRRRFSWMGAVHAHRLVRVVGVEPLVRDETGMQMQGSSSSRVPAARHGRRCPSDPFVVSHRIRGLTRDRDTEFASALVAVVEAEVAPGSRAASASTMIPR